MRHFIFGFIFGALLAPALSQGDPATQGKAGAADSTATNASMSAEGASGGGANHNKKITYRKTQEVNFEDTDIDGKVHSPDGAYLLQKRGVSFLPLYKVNNSFEKNILGSVEYLR